MEKTKTLITHAIIGIALLLFGFYSVTEVYAFTIEDITTSVGVESCEYYSSTYEYCWDTTGGQTTNYMILVNMVTDSVSNTYQMAQSGFGVGTLADCDISGSVIYCVRNSQNTSYPHQIVKFDIASGSIIGRYNYTAGANDPVPTRITANGNIVYHSYYTASTSTYQIKVLDGSAFTLTSSPASTVITTLTTSSSASASLMNDGTYVYSILSSGANNYQVWRMDTSTAVCSATGSAGSYQEYNSALGKLILSIGNAIYTQTPAQCGVTLVKDAGVAITGIQYDSHNALWYLSSSALIKVYNSTGTLQYSVDLTSSGSFKSLVFNYGQNKIFAPMPSSSKIRIVTLGAPNESGGSTFCDQAENFYLLRCVLERGDTTPLSGASELVNASSTNIVCQIGLIHCTQNSDGSFTPDNPDIQTNGVGYLLLVVALGIMIGIFWVASRGDLGYIPTFIWFIGTLAIIGVMTAFSWINPTILIIAIIAIIALATAKVKGVFGSSGLFAGET
jgi:hypothetical protein